MNWNIDFISQNDFENHVAHTISYYGEKLTSYDISKFNANLIDPIKLIFDKSVYSKSWQELINSEIFRQRDKSNTNEIGYFHQRLFRYIKNCRVPDNGKDGGWDIICDFPNGYEISDTEIVHTIFIEMKNKHNTMNSSSSGKTYIKMQNQLLKADDCACFLVEAIASTSQNIVWKTTVDGQKVFPSKIRRISIDRFYEMVTGDTEAFLKICLALPDTIKEVLSKTSSNINPPHDTVCEELRAKAADFHEMSEDAAMTMSLYILGFKEYLGFNKFSRSLTR